MKRNYSNFHQIFLTIFSFLFLFRATFVHAEAEAEAEADAQAETRFAWSVIDYDWPSDQDKANAIKNQDFIEVNNAISGIKVYGDWVYLTVPRWLHGVPSTLNRISISNQQKSPPLIPYPSWKMNKFGDCDALQYVQSMEIVPQTAEIQK